MCINQDQELRWKNVNFGYDLYLKTNKLSWPNDPKTGVEEKDVKAGCAGWWSCPHFRQQHCHHSGPERVQRAPGTGSSAYKIREKSKQWSATPVPVLLLWVMSTTRASVRGLGRMSWGPSWLPTRMTGTSYQRNWYWSVRGESSEHSSHGIFKFWEVGTFTANLISCPHPNVRGRGRGQVWRRGRDRKTYWAESEQLLSSCRWTWQVVWTFRKCCFNRNVRDCS